MSASLISLAEVVARILLLVGVGVVLRATGLLPRRASETLNTVLLYVAIPALVFDAIYPAKIDYTFLGEVGIAWAVGLAGLLLAWVAGRAMRLPRPALGAFMLVAALGNTGYLGYPIVSQLFGEPGLVRAVFYDVFGTVLILLTLGLFVAARMGERAERVNLLREIVTFPVVIAVVAALLLKPVPIPTLVTGWLDALAKMTVPLIMISLGLTLDWGKLRGHMAWSGAAAAIKLAIVPLLAWGLAMLFIREPLLVRVSVLEAGMPSMMLSLVVAARFGLDLEFTASAIMLTTVASAVTLPLLMLVMR